MGADPWPITAYKNYVGTGGGYGVNNLCVSCTSANLATPITHSFAINQAGPVCTGTNHLESKSAVAVTPAKLAYDGSTIQIFSSYTEWFDVK